MLFSSMQTHQSCPGSFCSSPVSWVTLIPPCRALGAQWALGILPIHTSRAAQQAAHGVPQTLELSCAWHGHRLAFPGVHGIRISALG